MTAHFRSRFLGLTLALLSLGAASQAQLTGTKTVPSAAYPTLAVAIDSLNQYGVGTGGVTINFTPSTNETAPTGGYRLGSATLNGTTSATNKITINGNGNLITAYTGTSSSADGIFYIMGTDYVTINNLNLTDKTTNTSTTQRMEWGYSLVKQKNTTPYDGCQHVTINGCVITLNGTYTNTIGIRSAHSLVATTSTLSTSSLTMASSNSYNSFTGNSISNVARGISLIGSSSLAGYDKDNKIGGTTAASGNTIILGAPNGTLTVYGTYTQYDSVITIQNNSISFATGMTSSSAKYGIYMSTGVGDMDILNNNIDLTCNQTSGNVYAFYNYGSSSGHRDASTTPQSMVTTHTITGNRITGTNLNTGVSYFYGIYEYYAYCKNMIISNNIIENVDWNAQYIYSMYTGYSGTPYITIEDNDIRNINNRYTTGYTYGHYHYHYNSTIGVFYFQRNKFHNVTGRYGIYPHYIFASYTTPPTGYNGQKYICRHNIVDSLDVSAATSTSYIYDYIAYYGQDSTEVSYNRLSNVKGSNTGTTYCYWQTYGYYAPNSYTVKGNTITNIQGNNLYNYNYLGYYATLCDSNTVSNITTGINGGTSGGLINYLGFYGTNYVVSNNRITNINSNGAYCQNYMGYYGSDANVHHNAITNYNIANNGYMYNYVGYNVSNGGEYHHNRIDSITQAGSATFYPWYSYASTAGVSNMHDNIISNLTTASTSISWYPYYLQTAGATAVTYFYNNFLTNLNFPSGYNGTNGIGVNLSSAGIYHVYNNTIRISPISGANFGYTGIGYTSTSILDLRNNIINVNVTPGGSGYTTALRRTSGTNGNTPANFLGSSNGNIYYAPNVANSWLYGEGSSSGGMVNTYNLTNDPNFNTPCGKFKSFIGHDQASFTENNLVAGTLPGTYLPTGVSYAEKGGVPTSSPAVVTDFAGVTRGAVADMGALEFAGTALDNAPPIVSFTPVPVRSYCVTTPTLLVTITDNSGVNTTTGTAPRLYYKKASENNTFGANTNTTNGWKYVEPTSASGSVYTFDFDYSLLTSGVTPGDSITYFIIAQDNASTPNTGATIAGFPVCPGTVALGSPHGPLNANPVPHGFKILPTPTFRASGFPGSACLSGSSVMSVLPIPEGATVQWQSATMTGSFSNITGATNNTYNTPVNTTTMRYRAVISCGTATLATSTIDTFIIANPSIISTTGASRCGYGSLTLSATGAPFTTASWYTTATGGTAFHSGNSYTTPNISSTTTYYVSGNTPNASTEMVGIPTAVPYSYTYADGYGLEMVFRNPATNFYSTTVYPYNASGSFHVELWDSTMTPTGYSAGPFTVSGGAGTTPVVLQLNWNNIPAGRYYLVTNNRTGNPYLNFEYMNPTLRGYTWPINSPSGNASIIAGRYSTVTYYYTFFYNNIIGADCESTAPRKPVTATITPAPPVTASSPGSPGICTGTSTTITATSANVSYNYVWTPGPMLGPTHTVSPTATTTYYLTSTDPYTGCVDFDSVVLAVNPVPAPPTITPTNPTICEGSSVMLRGSAPPGSAGTGTVGSGTTRVSNPGPFYGTWEGNHVQMLIRASELIAAGIKPNSLLTSLAFESASSGYALTNFTLKLANVSMTALNSFAGCPPGMVTVYTHAGVLTPPSSGWNTFTFNGAPFLWTGGDLLVAATHQNCTSCPTSISGCGTFYGTSATVYAQSTSYTSVRSVYDDANCSIPTCSPSGNSSSSTNRPNMRFDFKEPSDLNWLNVAGLYKNAGLSSPVSLTDTNTIVYASPTTTTVYRAVTNAQGCLSAPSAPDTVFVNPAPKVTITPAGPQTICSGQPVTLCIPTGSNQSYQWFLNNVAIAGANSNCYVAGAAGSYTVTAVNIVTGCSATSLPTVLTVNPLPTITATAGGPTTICNGSSVILTANSPTAVAWQWQESGVNIPGATSSTYAATTSGAYTVMVTNTVSCTNTSNVVNVTVNTTPSTVNPLSSTTFCAGGSVVLQGPTGSTLTYQWHDATGPIGGATSSSYTATTTGNYWVVVTDNVTLCSSTSAPVAVTVGAGPNASISPSGTVNGCQGGTVTLSAVSQPGLCYQWNLNGTPIPGATSSTYAAGANGAYTVTVSICSTPGCNATTTSPTTINMNTLPAASVTPTTVPAFCAGSTATLTANTGTGLTYQWNLNGTPISGATGSVHNAASTGSYTVTVTNTATGCSNLSNAVAITVTPLPTINITPASPTTFCQGGNVVLNASPGFGTYTWRRNGVVTGGPGSSLTVTTTGQYTVSVSTGSCSNTSATTSVQVNALPNVQTVPSGNAAVCQGYTTTLTVSLDTAHSYQWFNGINPIAGAVNNTYTTGVAGNYTVRVTNTVTGCVATSAAIVLSVNTPPVATASAVGSTTICQDDSVRLNAPTGAGLMYQWKYNGNDIVGATNSSYYAKLGGRYTVAVSNATNCVTLSNSLVITVNPRPAAYITYNTPLEFCEGSAVVLVANAGTGLTYQWIMDGTPIGNTSDINISKVSGLYSLQVTNNFGCVTTSDTLDVTVWPTPVPAINRPNSTTLETAIPYVSYQWFFNNVAIGGATNQSLTFTQNGAYKVRVTDANGCEGYSNQYFVNNVGIVSTAAGRSIRVYPNPTSGVVHIESSVKVKVVLRDVTGKEVLSAENVKEVDLGDVANGMYLLYISDLDGQLLRAEKLTKTNH